MAVIAKKDEKAINIISLMKNKNDKNEFIELFKQHFPKEYKKIWDRYINQKILNEKNSSKCPMPFPDKYLENTYKFTMKKYFNKK